MATDLRKAILAKLDGLTQDHQPCDPGADCLHRAVDALRAVVELHRPDGEHCADCDWVRPCPTERVVGVALGILEVEQC